MLDVLRSRDVRAAKAYITHHILTAKDRLLAYCEWPRPYPDLDGLSQGELMGDEAPLGRKEVSFHD